MERCVVLYSSASIGSAEGLPTARAVSCCNSTLIRGRHALIHGSLRSQLADRQFVSCAILPVCVHGGL